MILFMQHQNKNKLNKLIKMSIKNENKIQNHII
jgi:hypothetical protein